MISSFSVTIIFLSFLITKFVLEQYLDYRNKKHISNHRDQVPDKFKDKITLSEHQKAADYSITKIKFGRITEIIDVIVLIFWTIGGGLELIDQYIRNLNYGPLLTGILLFAIFGCVSFIIQLPQSVYITFFLEEKYGFNKTTPKTFILDIIKSLILSLIIGVPVLLAILWIMEFLGNWWWLYAWLFITLVQLIIIFMYPTIIAPLFNKFTPLDEGQIKEKILSLLKRTDFKSKGLFVMDASKRSLHGNAYFTGFGKNKRIVFFDTILKSLEPEEIEAVLAHELGHFKKKHILKGLIRSIIFGLIGLGVLGYLYKTQSFFTGHGVNTPSSYMALLLFALVSGVYLFPLKPIASIWSRKYELEADRFAAKYANGNMLISALVKLFKDNASTLTPDPIYSAIYQSHPPASTRVQHLEMLIQKENNNEKSHCCH